MSEHVQLEFGIELVTLVIGALIGIGLSVVAREVKEWSNKKKRKDELYYQIGKEVDGIISAIKHPTALNLEYKPFFFEPTLLVINGGQLNLRLTADIYATSSTSLGLLPYDLVDSISALAIDIGVYSQQVDYIHKFNHETVPTDPERRKIVGKQLIDNAKLQINAISDQCENVKKILEETK